MPQGTCTRNEWPGNSYFHLQDATDIIPLMTQLLQINWQAVLRSYTVDGAATWDLHITNTNTNAEYLSPQDREKTMHLGDVGVYDPVTGSIVTMRIEDFNSQYTKD